MNELQTEDREINQAEETHPQLTIFSLGPSHLAPNQDPKWIEMLVDRLKKSTTKSHQLLEQSKKAQMKSKQEKVSIYSMEQERKRWFSSLNLSIRRRQKWRSNNGFAFSPRGSAHDHSSEEAPLLNHFSFEDSGTHGSEQEKLLDHETESISSTAATFSPSERNLEAERSFVWNDFRYEAVQGQVKEWLSRIETPDDDGKA